MERDGQTNGDAVKVIQRWLNAKNKNKKKKILSVERVSAKEKKKKKKKKVHKVT